MREQSRPRRPRLRDRQAIRVVDQGSAAAEVVILTPLLVLLALVLMIAGRLVDGAEVVDDAARTAVESAVIASTPQEAQVQAANTASYEIRRNGLQCSEYSMVTEVADFTAGGSVSVRIRCRIALVTFEIPGLPTSVSLSGRASAAIEFYREVG
jgi:Flp pilus assembly protein TadG